MHIISYLLPPLVIYVDSHFIPYGLWIGLDWLLRSFSFSFSFSVCWLLMTHTHTLTHVRSLAT